jgi:hypothetical protein
MATKEGLAERILKDAGGKKTKLPPKMRRLGEKWNFCFPGPV